jgi:Abi-like protein
LSALGTTALADIGILLGKSSHPQARPAVVGDNFKPGVEFRHIIDLYVFDKKLRMAMLDAIERVEIGFRTSIALLLGPRDPWAHRIAAQLDGTFARRVDRRTGRIPHQEWLAKLDESFNRSNEAFATHFARHTRTTSCQYGWLRSCGISGCCPGSTRACGTMIGKRWRKSTASPSPPCLRRGSSR